MSTAEPPLHTPNWPKSIAALDAYDGSDSLRLSWDLGIVPEREKAKTIKAWTIALPRLQNLKRLSVWSHVTQPLFDSCCKLEHLEVLQIKWSNIQKLDAISQLSGLVSLSIGSSTRVQSIEPLTTLKSLEILEIENFKLISDFSPLIKLTTLRDLSVVGSMWSKQAVSSLEPFAQMTWLTSLAVDTSHVSSLRPLGRMKQLEALGLGGRLPFEEYAWLSAQLPSTTCRWFEPFLDMSNLGYSRCKQCKRASMVMLTGKGKPVLCRYCDGPKLDKHIGLFLAAKAAA